MTKLKLSGMTHSATSALEPYVRDLYDSPTRTVVAIVELEHVERTQPGPKSDKQATVTARLAQCEPADGERADALREALRTLYFHRTARGTFDEVTGPVLDERTLTRLGGDLNAIDAARGRTVAQHWGEYAASAANIGHTKPTIRGLIEQLHAIRDGLLAYANGTPGAALPPVDEQ